MWLGRKTNPVPPITSVVAIRLGGKIVHHDGGRDESPVHRGVGRGDLSGWEGREQRKGVVVFVGGGGERRIGGEI